MKLEKFEIEILKIMISDRLTSNGWCDFLADYKIIGYEYTGAGYFLKISSEKLDLKNEVIHDPVPIGKIEELELGFLIYIEDNNIIIECHSWGIENPPENIRKLNVKIISDEKSLN
jgi:hypothetical protein